MQVVWAPFAEQVADGAVLMRQLDVCCDGARQYSVNAGRVLLGKHPGNVTGQQTGWSAWSSEEAKTALSRYEFHSYKRTQDKHISPETLEIIEKLPPMQQPEAAKIAAATESASAPAERKRAVIEAALARARAQRGTNA